MSAQTDSLTRAEWAAAGLLTAVILSLLMVRATHAGGLWRDECGTVELAQLPTYADLVRSSPLEEFPLLFPTTVRLYTKVFGSSDTALRGFGFGVGALVIGMLWLNAWKLRNGPPLLALALLGLNTSLLLWTTTIRAYGVGVVLILLVFGLVGQSLARSKPWLWGGTWVASLGAVHCLLHNSALFLAIGVAAMLVFLVRRQPKPALIMMGVGALAGVSLLPYIGLIASSYEWDMLVKYPVGLPWLWQQFKAALGAPLPWLAWIWFALFVAVMAGAIWQIRRGRELSESRNVRSAITQKTKSGSRSSSLDHSDDLLVFGMCVLVVSVIAYGVFLKVLSYHTQPWYYLSLMALLAAALDLLIGRLAEIRWVRVGRLGFAVVAMVVLPFAAWPKITTANTNINLLAKHLEQEAKPGDMIVLAPWYHGITFHRYYRGATPWATLPMIPEHRMHRYDLIKEIMTSPAPLADLKAAMAKTLQAGGRVWIVGEIDFPRRGETPVALPPAPHPESGWRFWPYEYNWSLQIGAFMRDHMTNGVAVTVPGAGRVSEFENAKLLMGEGWR